MAATLATLRSTVEEQPEPFLCFLRQSVGDVLVGQTKIAGSAERRRKGVILQHGSVLLETSVAAPELPGIAALTGKTSSPGALAAAWSQMLAKRMQFDWQPGTLRPDEIARARTLEAEKFATAAWNARR